MNMYSLRPTGKSLLLFSAVPGAGGYGYPYGGKFLNVSC